MRRYLGSKTKILKEIQNFVNKMTKSSTAFVDVFSGSGSVTEHFSKKYKTYSNDYMHFSFITSSAYNATSYNIDKLVKISLELNKLYLNKPTKGDFVYSNFTPKGRRNYFSKKNGIKIDRIRQRIEEHYILKKITNDEYAILLHSLIDGVQQISNITGTYSAYLKKWDSRALKDYKFTLILPSTLAKEGSKSFNLDAIEFMEKLNALRKAIIYLDPPYTSLDYSGAYHILETITRYDAPIIKGISGRRKGKESNYHKKTKAYNEFDKLIKNLPFNNDIIISYSSHGILSLEEFEKIINKAFPLSKITVKKFKYRTYSNVNKHQKCELKEYLIHFYAHPAIKAPFNYQGSKEKIAYEIRKIIPTEERVVEIFGGGLNLGINLMNTNIVYNDISEPLVKLIRKLKSSPQKTTLKIVESLINNFKLSKNNKLSFEQLRKSYNQDQEPIKLLVILLFTFNYQIRFNSSGKFNNPVGLGGYSLLKREQIIDYVKILKMKKIQFFNKDFRKFNFENQYGSIFYFDPPYLITKASYNDGKRGSTGWNANLEELLLIKINKLSIDGQKFVLSNVLEHKNLKNNILIKWIEDNKFKVKKIKYKNRIEVLIYNY